MFNFLSSEQFSVFFSIKEDLFVFLVIGQTTLYTLAGDQIRSGDRRISPVHQEEFSVIRRPENFLRWPKILDHRTCHQPIFWLHQWNDHFDLHSFYIPCFISLVLFFNIFLLLLFWCMAKSWKYYVSLKAMVLKHDIWKQRWSNVYSRKDVHEWMSQNEWM